MWLRIALAALLLLIGNGMHSLWDRDEPRNAVASRNMIWTGDWITPVFNGELRAHKPILVNWSQAVSLKLFGGEAVSPEPGWAEFAVRLPSAVSGILTVCITMLLALRLGMGVNGALMSSAIVLTSPLFLMVHKAATTDGILIAATWWAILLWHQQREKFSWLRHGLFSVAVAVTILQKGPVGPLLLVLFVLATAAVEWRLRRAVSSDSDQAAESRTESGGRAVVVLPSYMMRTVLLLCINLLLVGPWLVAVHIATDGEFLREALGRHVIQRAAQGSINGHSGPLWFYLPVVLLMVLPLLPVVLAGLRQFWLVRARLPVVISALAAWTVAVVAVFSLFQTKLPHYILPVLPAVALVAAAGLRMVAAEGPGMADALPTWLRWTGSAFYGVAGVAGLAALLWAAVFFVGPVEMAQLRFPTGLLGALVAVWAALGLAWWRLNRVGWLASAGVVGVAIFWALVVTGFMRTLEPLRASPLVARAVRQIAPDARLGAVGYQEPSLVWYHGREVEMMGRRRPWPAMDFLAGEGHRVLLIERHVYDRWLAETTATLPRPVWNGRALDLQREIFSELLLLENSRSAALAPGSESRE